MKFAALLMLAAVANAEVHRLTLKQAAARALAQNPDGIIARLDEQAAQQRARAARDPFFPKIYAGSGLAYSSGFPMSIEGSAPSIVQARAVGTVFDRSKSYQLAQTRELARGAGIATEAKLDDAVLRTVQLWLDAGQAARNAEAAQRQLETTGKLEDLMRARVEAGRELPLESKKASLETAKARQRTQSYESERDLLQSNLAAVLGFAPGDRVEPAEGERPLPELPLTEEAAREQAWKQNKELRQIESNLAAKELEAKSIRALRLPKLDLVAQYGLFAKFNNYEEYFNRFQRNNGQIGVSVQVPLLLGPAASAEFARTAVETMRLRTERIATRNRIALEIEEDYQALRRAQSSLEVSRLDLDVARESLDVLLKRFEIGEGDLAGVETARRLESEKWIAWYTARHQLERAGWALMHRTGTLTAALR